MCKLQLNKISFCGIKFGHTKWHSHMNKCDVCGCGYDEMKLIFKKCKDSWVKLCECGCGSKTKVNNNFIIGHSQKGVTQTDEHKENKLNAWLVNGNREKNSERWKKNNPSSTEKNRKRLRENNPAKNELVRKKISENNPMKVQKYIDKIFKTKEERYGDGNYNNHELFKKTFIEKYGVDNPSKVTEFLEKRIDTYTKRLSNGDYVLKNNWVCGTYTTKGGVDEWYDSSYELTKMRDYDDKGYDWTKKHGIRVPYIKNNGIKSYYVPDFLITFGDSKVIVEIKGWLKNDDILKAQTCIEWSRLNGYEYYFILGEKMVLNHELSLIINKFDI